MNDTPARLASDVVYGLVMEDIPDTELTSFSTSRRVSDRFDRVFEGYDSVEVDVRPASGRNRFSMVTLRVTMPGNQVTIGTGFALRKDGAPPQKVYKWVTDELTGLRVQVPLWKWTERPGRNGKNKRVQVRVTRSRNDVHNEALALSVCTNRAMREAIAKVEGIKVTTKLVGPEAEAKRKEILDTTGVIVKGDLLVEHREVAPEAIRRVKTYHRETQPAHRGESSN